MGINNEKNYNEKRVANRAILLSFIVFSFIIIVFYKSINKNPKNTSKIEVQNDDYFKTFNESFKGIIIDKKTTIQSVGENKLCLLKVKLSQSSIKYYDPRDSLRLYFCIINYPYAEVFFYEYYYHLIDIGDSCLFDGENDKFCIGFINQNEVIWRCEKPIINKKIHFFKELHTIPFIDAPKDYYMLMFAKYKKKENLSGAYKKLSDKNKYKGKTIPQYFERRYGYYYFFLSDKRYGSYQEVYKAWKEAGYSELYIAKFDKHNRFIKMLEKQKKK